MIQPLISIAIPAFKRKFLRECIHSVLCQTYDNYELIIVDDASPENLFEIVEPFLQDKRVQYYKNKRNCGAVDVVDNWNICLSHCVGDYVICMGDDDKLLPDSLSIYVDLINRYPGLGLYHAWTEIIDENSNFKGLQAPRVEFETVYSLIWNRWENRHVQYIGDFLFDTSVLRRNGGFYKLPLAWGSDDISAVIAASFNGVANTQKIAFQYRVNSQTISNGGYVNLKIATISQEKEWYVEFLAKEPNGELEKKYYRLLKSLVNPYFNKKFGEHIAGDISNNFFNFFYWYNRRKVYGYSINCLLYALYFSFKERHK